MPEVTRAQRDRTYLEGNDVMDSAEVGRMFTEFSQGLRDPLVFAFDPASGEDGTIVHAGPHHGFLDGVSSRRVNQLVVGLLSSGVLAFEAGSHESNPNPGDYVKAAKCLINGMNVAEGTHVAFIFRSAPYTGSNPPQVVDEYANAPRQFKDKFGDAWPKTLRELANA
ncbi:Uncharacterised protein [uncultured archaeon]|nr:Uncharacterised protein [uncultured archaeon]